MDIVVLIFRILFLVLGSLMGIFYILFQFYQKLPAVKLQFKTMDYVVLALVALLFGFGVNSYWGLLAVTPLLILKIICPLFIKPKYITGSGCWIEVQWKKLTPRGFERTVPKAMLAEMSKMPGDTHFIIPRPYFRIALFFIRKKMFSEFEKNKGGGVPMSAQQQNLAMGQFKTILDNLSTLSQGKTERKDFPFGMLKVTRL